LAQMVRAIRRPSRGRLVAAGLLFGAAALTRSSSLYLVPLLAAIIAVPLRSRALVFVTAFAAVAVPYIAAASLTSGRLVLIENVLEQDWAEESAILPAQASAATLIPSVLSAASDHGTRFLRDGAGRLHRTLRPDPWFSIEEAGRLPAPIDVTLR